MLLVRLPPSAFNGGRRKNFYDIAGHISIPSFIHFGEVYVTRSGNSLDPGCLALESTSLNGMST